MKSQSLEASKTQSAKDYKAQYKLEDRKKRVQQYKEKYPDMIPIIVQKHPKAKLMSLKNSLYIVKLNFKFSDLKNKIRTQLQLSQKEALFFYCGNNIISDDVSLQELYNKYKDREDEFLYLTYLELQYAGNSTD